VRRALGYVQGTVETPASVVTINAIVAAIGADALIKWITGFSKTPRWLRYDLLAHQSTSLNFASRPGCPICGEEGLMGLGAEEETPLLPLNPGNGASFFARSSREAEIGAAGMGT
jgi:hypothetical protein